MVFQNVRIPSGLAVVVSLLTMVLTAVALSSHVDKERTLCGPNPAPIVNTEGGKICGVTKISTRGKPFSSYESIPFAQPPVGGLRFERPVEGVNWTGVRDGSNPPPPCPQLPSPATPSVGYGKEDCLYLNVFTSTTRKPTEPSLPVLVFIHGGSYTIGYSDLFQPYAFLNEDVVLVTLQYRLNILGFLSTEDDVLPGNLGLWDQLSALRWVSRNIHQFGGDPERVTIFGQSAGASSVHLLVLSPWSKGLFRRAIMQSGSALCSWALGSSFKQTAVKLANIVGCNSSLASSQDLVNCLRGVESNTLVAALPQLKSPLTLPIVLGPRVDGKLIPVDPLVLAATENYTNVDLIFGYTSQDGAEMLGFIHAANAEASLSANFDQVAPATVDYHRDDGNQVWLTRRVYEYYTGGPKLEPYDDFVKMTTDRLFGSCADLSAILHAKISADNTTGASAHTYRYIFSHSGQHSYLDQFNMSIGDNWVSHADELYLMFPGAALWRTVTYPADLAVRDIFTKLWADFAATGNPTPDASLGFTWAPVTPDQQQYLNIVPSPSMVPEPSSHRRARVFLLSLPTRQNRLLWTLQTTDPFCAGTL